MSQNQSPSQSAPHPTICHPCISGHLHRHCPPLPALLPKSYPNIKIKFKSHFNLKPNHSVLNCPIDKGSILVGVTTTRKCSGKNPDTHTPFGNYRTHCRGVEKRDGEKKQPINGILSSQFLCGQWELHPVGNEGARVGPHLNYPTKR